MHKKVTDNDSKSYLSYLNKLVDQYKNTYYLDKKPINADYSALTEKLKRTIKPVNLTLMIESELVNITKDKNIFSKAYTHSMSREIFAINSVLNTNSGT